LDIIIAASVKLQWRCLSSGIIHTFMKNITPLIITALLVFLLSACSKHSSADSKLPSDANLTRQIAGTWTVAGAGTMAFAPDGSFVIAKKSDTRTLTGAWQIKDGDLILTVTNINGNSQAGNVIQSKILSMDAHQFVYNSAGRTATLSR
jgi:hypothetical protein